MTVVEAPIQAPDTAIVEDLSEEEAYLYAILTDPSGLDQAEFLWYDPSSEDGCFRAWAYQWAWWRTQDQYQIDQSARSVGKSLSIKARGFAFPFVHPGSEMVITAPELVHLEPITGLIESQVYATRLSSELLQRGKSGVTHRPFQMNFSNGSRIIGRIPQRDGKGVKGIHPIWLELDEAQDYPHAGWVELNETLKAGFDGAIWRAHGVTRGARDDFYEKTRDDPDNHWRVHRFPAMIRPNWTDQERQDKIKQYGSQDDPDYRRNVLGEHGDATNPLFVLTRLMKCVDDDQTSDYNADEYTFLQVKEEGLQRSGQDIRELIDLPARHLKYLGPNKTKPKAIFWVGMDVGFTVDPTEILVWVEYRHKPNDEFSVIKLLTRIQLIRIGTTDQTKAVLHVLEHYAPRVFAMDRGGLGLPLVKQLQEWVEAEVGGENEVVPQWAKAYNLRDALTKIKGYNFSEKLTVDLDPTIEISDPEKAEAEAGQKRNAKEYASDTLRVLVDQTRLELPWDRELLKEWQGGSWSQAKGFDQYGRKVFSKGNDHTLDAGRYFALGWAQYGIEELLGQKAEQESVYAAFF